MRKLGSIDFLVQLHPQCHATSRTGYFGALREVLTELRARLGDDRASPIYIRTVPKRGYSLIAGVEALSGQDIGAESALPPSLRPMMKSGALLFLFVFLGVCVLLLAAQISNERVPVDPQSAVIEPAPKSIAVLSFVNLSEDPDNQYFSDGLAEDLLNGFARIEGLQVAARTSSFVFAGRNEDVKSIGRKLNVATVLEGSVRRVGNRVRITAQLVNVADGFQLWSKSFDRDLDDVFAIQDEITRDIVETLKTQVPGRDQSKDGAVGL